MNIGIVIALLTFLGLWRVFIIWVNNKEFKKGFSGDSSGHYYFIKKIKENWKLRKIDNFVIPNEMTYALGFHRYASLFTEKILKEYSFIPNLIIYTSLSTIFIIHEIHILDTLNSINLFYQIACLSLVVYLLEPINLVFLGPNITYINLSERLLSMLSCSLFCYFLFVFLLQDGGDLELIGGVFFGGIALVSSTFGRQVFLFCIPLTSLFLLNFYPLIFLTGSFALALILDRGYFIKSLTGTIKYWSIYSEFISKDSSWKKYALRYTNPYHIVYDIKQMRIVSLMKHIYETNPARLISFYPNLILGIVNAVHLGEYIYIGFVLPFIILYILTALPRFAHLGEAYRYIEYSMVLVSVFFNVRSFISFYYQTEIKYIFFGEMIYLILCFLMWGWLIFLTRKKSEKPVDRLGEILNLINIDKNHVIFPISMRTGLDLSARVNCKVFWWQPGGITDREMFMEYFDYYPFLKSNWNHLFEKHKVSHVIANKVELSRFKGKYKVDKLKVLAENEAYISYEVNPTTNEI